MTRYTHTPVDDISSLSVVWRNTQTSIDAHCTARAKYCLMLPTYDTRVYYKILLRFRNVHDFILFGIYLRNIIADI